MNKYILTERLSLIKLNTETLKVNNIGSSYNVDHMWTIEEDGVLTYFDKEYEVKAGNVMMLMYPIGDEEHGDIVVIDNKDLTNYERRKKYYEEQKGREKAKGCCCDCECVSQSC